MATFDMLSRIDLEKLIDNPRVRMWAAIVGGVVLLFSMGCFVASHGSSIKIGARSEVIPDQPLNVPIMRQLPSPQPMKAKPARVATAQR